MVRSNTRSLLQHRNNIGVIVSKFGSEVTRKLRAGDGSQEDHVRGPFEQMLIELGRSMGLTASPIGETRLPDLSVRPDYAVDVGGVRVGYVEIKKPGHGVPGVWKRPSRHDKEQWGQLQLLPNVLYTDGQSFGRYKFGKLQGKIGRLEPPLNHAGRSLHVVDGQFESVLADFLCWEPERPRTLEELVRLVANLCRLLRDDVAAELARERNGESASYVFNGLANDWRQVLFPNLTDKEFADQYAQTVTFALLLARVESVSFENRSISEIARLLGMNHSLMGVALSVLTGQAEDEQSVALTTMMRVIGVVNWSHFPEDSYAMLYETFLTRYDPNLRRKSGVYYTPAPVVSFMTSFVDSILRDRLNRRSGFAEEDVIIVDPAMGTGSFLAEVINTVAKTSSEEEGAGVVTPRLRELSNRLIGFENQAAPYAVAELRIHSLLKKRHRAEVPLQERRFLADTLDDPDLQLLPMGSLYDTMKRVRDGANMVKREEPVMVVIGNPPYVDKIRGTAPWIEAESDNLSAGPSIKAFRKPGNGRLEYVLSNKYVYFWRWATWKAFDAHRSHPAGVVAMICSAGFTAGPGFAGMREYLRRTSDEGWIIDLSPEGHQPPMATRVFKGNQQPICIAVFIRRGPIEREAPARIHRTSVHGTFEEKCTALQSISLDSNVWWECLRDWSDPFMPEGDPSWLSMPSMVDLMPWSSPGVKPNRTWVYAPSKDILIKRWRIIVSSELEEKGTLFGESRDANLDRVNPALFGFHHRKYPFSEESGPCPVPIQVGYRAFDRQWLIPDSRLIATARPSMWAVNGDEQIFVTEQHAHPTGSGPALIFTNLLPDMDYHSGRGGRVLPLYRDAECRDPNFSPGLLEYLSTKLNHLCTAPDLFAYIAATVSHSGYTERFVAELKTPGVRVPLTSDLAIWKRAVEIGRELIWIHTYGERYSDPSAERPYGPPMARSAPPRCQVTIPDTEQGMPENMEYDDSSRTLFVGNGQICPVSPAVWNYEISGMRVVKHWFGYRKKQPSGKRKSPLDRIVSTRWTPAMTTELLRLLNVIGRCVELESRQEETLSQILAGSKITVDDLISAGVLPTPPASRKPQKVSSTPGLWNDRPRKGSEPLADLKVPKMRRSSDDRLGSGTRIRD